MGERIGVGAKTIAAYEGGNQPKRAILQRIADLGINLHWLVTGQGDMCIDVTQIHNLHNIDPPYPQTCQGPKLDLNRRRWLGAEVGRALAKSAMMAKALADTMRVGLEQIAEIQDGHATVTAEQARWLGKQLHFDADLIIDSPFLSKLSASEPAAATTSPAPEQKGRLEGPLAVIHNVPIVARATAGFARIFTDDETDLGEISWPPELCALIIHDDSMEPVIRAKQMVLVDYADNNVGDGDLAIVEIDGKHGRERAFKRVRFLGKNQVLLESANPAHRPEVWDKKDIAAWWKAWGAKY